MKSLGETETKIDSQNFQILSVAIPRPLQGLFTYELPEHLKDLVRVGGWVRVPFGRSVTHAFVVELPQPYSSLPLGLKRENLKAVIEVGSEDSVFADDVWALCRWAHEYYQMPLGEVLNCAAPAASLGIKKVTARKKKKSHPLERGVQYPLTEDQVSVVEAIHQMDQHKKKTVLLNGVTGSGKTEVYIELAKKALKQDQGVLILVPEIALTPQVHHRFESALGVPVALWHSAVSFAQRRDQALDLRAGKIRVVVGARSAVFAPVKNLGLIVVDEEHDPTFKQEERMRYQARDLAVVRGKICQALVVLGSATPSLESRERVREGKYIQLDLPRRIAPGGHPQVELVDLRVEPQVEPARTSLALKTLEAIRETLSSQEQVMIYLNRRGFAAFLICEDCGEVKGCPVCSISLTVYKKRMGLRCHLCGHEERIPELCQKCQGIDLLEMGAGTESLEEELCQWIPEAKILRLDRDKITSTTRLNSILKSFRAGEANVLLGTQMLVKGHDFPEVTLVVVVTADPLFRWPDFRAPERAYQILRQVSGRAGRGQKPGRVMIQSYDTDHPVLQVMEGKISEESFLSSERSLRLALNYPPFGRLVRIRFENSSTQTSEYQASQVANQLRSSGGELDLLGPSEAFVKKMKGLYRWDLLLKAKDVGLIQKAMHDTAKICMKNKWPFWVDVDPYGI